MSNQRIKKKVHSRFLGEFCVEASQDEKWLEYLGKLEVGQSIESGDKGLPQDFAEIFEEVNAELLNYSAERVALEQIPRRASCWWPQDQHAHYFAFYPTDFPQTKLYLMMDCLAESGCSH